ncbi:MAG: APC family permease [Solirubrobacterales bacterium]|nr:APC family permease [Solirubrobacterales bacterium]
MSSVPADPQMVEVTTALALEEKGKLVKSLSRLDMTLFTICAFVGLDTLGLVAANGPQGFLWLALLAVLFVIPYGLVMSEVGSAFPEEGGPYEWVKLAFGRFQGSIAAVLYWFTNPLWVGGSLAFIATAAWSGNITNIDPGGIWDYVFKLAFIWISIGVAIAALKRGKWIPNFGAIVRVLVLGLFSVTVIIYGLQEGFSGSIVTDITPTMSVFLALVPLLLFNYVGFELQNGAAEEMKSPQKDVPMSVLRSGVSGVLMYAIPILCILLVLPLDKVTGIGGFLDAVSATFTIYGGAADVIVKCVAIGFILTLVTSGSVWMIGSDRVLAVAAYDGAFAPFFGRFNARLGTPVRVNVLSGIVASIFMVAAVALFNNGEDSKFYIVLTIAISTTLLSYLWIFPAALKLRYSHGHVKRPYRVGDRGNGPMIVAVVMTTFWVALGSWVAIFPGTLESIFGVEYDFNDVWGTGRGTYELLTIGTLVVIVIVAIIGYAMGAAVRREQVTVAIDPGSESTG